MKKLNYVLGAILCVAVVGTANADLSDRITNCGYVADLATLIMEGRQNGTAARHFLEIPSPISPLVEEMVTQAYRDYPRHRTDALKDQVTKEFSNEWYVVCLQALR